MSYRFSTLSMPAAIEKATIGHRLFTVSAAEAARTSTSVLLVGVAALLIQTSPSVFARIPMIRAEVEVCGGQFKTRHRSESNRQRPSLLQTIASRPCEAVCALLQSPNFNLAKFSHQGAHLRCKQRFASTSLESRDMRKRKITGGKKASMRVRRGKKTLKQARGPVRSHKTEVGHEGAFARRQTRRGSEKTARFVVL